MKEYTLNNKHPRVFKLIQKYNEINYEKKNQLIQEKCKIDKIPNKLWERSKKIINDYEYIYTSSKTNKNICGINPVSRSYFKLYEILKDINNTSDNGYVACIAEGPGGFIHCLNDHTNMNVYGITLISEEDKSIPYWNQYIINNKNNKLFFDKSCDIYIYSIAKSFINFVGNNKCSLITADGGFDYSNNYNSQEESSYRLIYCEIFISLNIQKIGGSFIIKMFDLFNYKTIQLIYLLYLCYDKIIFYKPSTSRLSNSEKYITCIGFKGMNEEIKTSINNYYNNYNNFIIEIPPSFIDDIINYNDQFTQIQIETIQNIIENINKEQKDIVPSDRQITKAKDWCIKYGLPLNNKCSYQGIR